MSGLDLSGALGDFFTRPGAAPFTPPDTPDESGRRRDSRSSKYGSSPRSSRTVRTSQGAESSSSRRSRAKADEGDSPILPRVRLPFPHIGSDDEEWPPFASTSSQHVTSSASFRTWSSGGGNSSKHERRSVEKVTTTLEPIYTDVPPSRSATSRKSSASTSRPSRSMRKPSSSAAATTRSARSGSTSSAASLSRNVNESISPRKARHPRGKTPLGVPEFAKSETHIRQSRRNAAGSSLSEARSSRFLDAGTIFGSSAHLIKPLMAVFVCAILSSMATVVVSGVLLGSFSLTFYDDCGRRLIGLQREIGDSGKRIRHSIEGVRYGVGMMMGGATKALDLVVSATGAKRVYVHKAPEASMAEEDVEQELQSSRKRSLSEESDNGRSCPNPVRGRSRRLKPTRSSGAINAGVDELGTERRSNSEGETWTDDEQPPFDVPPSTPWHSRPASPSRCSPKRPTLPPRPPLQVLIPSILFALAFCAFKIVKLIWSKHPAEPWQQFVRRKRAHQT